MSHEKAVRKTIVESVRVEHMKPGDDLFPAKMFEHNNGEVGDIWWVWVSTRTGLMPPEIMSFICRSEDEATRTAERYAVGKEVDGQDIAGITAERHSFIQSVID